MKPVGLSSFPQWLRQTTAAPDRAKKTLQARASFGTRIEIVVDYTKKSVAAQTEPERRISATGARKTPASASWTSPRTWPAATGARSPFLRDAVVQGFQQAAGILGGLPEVSQETYRLVMEGFDEWRTVCLKDWRKVHVQGNHTKRALNS